jgi:hypothetical protein
MNGKYAVVCRPQDGTTALELNPEQETLDMLYSQIGCDLVEAYPLARHGKWSIDAWLDEEGAFKQERGSCHFMIGEDKMMFFGAVVILKTDMETGNTHGFEDYQELLMLNDLGIKIAYTPPMAESAE